MTLSRLSVFVGDKSELLKQFCSFKLRLFRKMSSILSPLKICVFRNGDRNYFGKSFVVPRRPVKDKEKEWDQLLDQITDQVGLNKAARCLCTPVGGREVRGVEELEHMKKYVAVTSGKFKKLP